MDKLLILRIIGCFATGWFYAKATRELKPIVAVIAIWAWMMCLHIAG